jgi:hypothetical protein
MVTLTDEVRQALTAGRLAHVATLNKSGVAVDNEVVGHTHRIVEGGAPELLQRLAKVHIGPGVKFPPMDSPPPGDVIHITPERVGGVGPWVQ